MGNEVKIETKEFQVHKLVNSRKGMNQIIVEDKLRDEDEFGGDLVDKGDGEGR
jgi:hypothetical protein